MNLDDFSNVISEAEATAKDEHFKAFHDISEFADDRGLYKMPISEFMAAVTCFITHYVVVNVDRMNRDDIRKFYTAIKAIPDAVVACLSAVQQDIF